MRINLEDTRTGKTYPVVWRDGWYVCEFNGIKLKANMLEQLREQAAAARDGERESARQDGQT